MSRICLLLFALLICFIYPPLQAQGPDVDSLVNELEKAPDGERLDIYLKLARKYVDINLDTSLIYVDKALDLALPSNNHKKLIEIYDQKSRIETNLGIYDQALKNARKVNQIASSINDSISLADAFGQISFIHEMQGSYDSAMVYAINSLSINEQINDMEGIGYSFRNLAILNLYTGNYEKALDYNRNCLSIFKKLGNRQGMSMGYINTGNNFYYLENWDSTLWYYGQAQVLSEELGDQEGKATTLHNMGVVAYMKGDFAQSEKYHIESLELREKLRILDHISLSYSSMGSLYEEQKKYNKAKIHYLKSIEIGNKIGALERTQYSYLGLSDISYTQGDYKSAYEYLEEYITIKDSLLNESKTEQIAALETKYQAEKKQAEIDLLTKDAEIQSLEIKRQRDQRNGLIVGFGLIGLLAFGLYRRNQYKLRVKKEQEAKEQALEAEREKTEFEKQKVEQLEKVDRLKDAFLANTSHELRTPLHGIIGLAQSMAERNHESHDQQDLNMIIYSGKRLAGLVNDILDFSKLKTNTIKLNQKAIDLNSMVDVVIRMSQHLVGEKNIILKKKLENDLPPIYADENRIQQILLNLVGNAIKFSHQGDIIIKGYTNGDQVAISISDQGIGIPKDHLEQIFQSFTQVEDSKQRHFEGTGLGLSITKQLVELHGGRISVESKEGHGSTFTFTIPAALGQEAELSEFEKSESIGIINQLDTSQSVAIANALEPKSDDSFKILVVDDDPVNQQVLKNYLHGDNFMITQAMNGDEAIKAINQNIKYDVVLLDIMMPGMSGYEVCEKIREYYMPSELPILMVTAKNQMDDLVEAFNLQANDYLVKPISKAELLARLGTHLNLLHINQSYSRFVPKEIFTALGRDNVLDVKLGDQIQEDVTVLFSDIRSFTTLSESMKVTENFQLLNGYLGRAVPVINAHQGLVQQFLGDGILALFLKGPENAVQAAISYQQMLIGYNKERVSKNRIPLRVGIGINTGSLMLGIIGDDQRQGAIVVSDTVNTTSRLEGLTKTFGVSIVVGEDTMNLLPNPSLFRHRRLGKVLVKGKKTAMDIFDFYGGDPSETILKKDETNADFEKALSMYYKGEFEESLLLFKKVIQINPEDKAAIRYQTNAAQFIVQGAPKNWTGIEEINVK